MEYWMMAGKPTRKPRPRKPIFTVSLRRLGDVLKDPSIGLGLRGTSWKEGQNRKKGIAPERGENIYAWQAPHPKEIKSNRQLVSDLRATLLASANFSISHQSLNWRNWKTPDDYPAILLLKNRKQARSFESYRGGYSQAVTTDYFGRSDPGGGHKQLKGFQKEFRARIIPEEVLAIVRPTKKEMRELEQKLKTRFGQDFGPSVPAFGLHLTNAFKRLMVNKAARALARVYRKELENVKNHK